METLGTFVWDLTSRQGLIDAVLDTVPVLVSDLKTGEILFCNQACERLFGYLMRGELRGRNVDELVPDEARRRHADHRRQYAASPAPRAMGASLSLSGRRRDGSNFPVEISLSPMLISDRACVVAVILTMEGRQRAGHAYPDSPHGTPAAESAGGKKG